MVSVLLPGAFNIVLLLSAAPGFLLEVEEARPPPLVGGVVGVDEVGEVLEFLLLPISLFKKLPRV